MASGDENIRFSALQRAEIAETIRDVIKMMKYFSVSVLFNEPKLLKLYNDLRHSIRSRCFSALQRAEIAETRMKLRSVASVLFVSVLFNEPKLLKRFSYRTPSHGFVVSVLFNEPKLLKPTAALSANPNRVQFQCSSTSRNC